MMDVQPNWTVGIRKRLLIINPNTNAAVTDRVRIAAAQIGSPGTEMVVVNPDDGPFSIESNADRDAAVPRVLSLIRSGLADRFDGYVLACFDDIGLREARSIVQAPVVGTCEAGIAAARTVAHRFSVVTTVHSAVPTIHGLLDRYGVSDICTVHAAGIGVAEAAGDGSEVEARIADSIRAAITKDGAEAILLGSGGLTGRAFALSQAFSIPVIDGVMAAVKMAEGLASLRLKA